MYGSSSIAIGVANFFLFPLIVTARFLPPNVFVVLGCHVQINCYASLCDVLSIILSNIELIFSASHINISDAENQTQGRWVWSNNANHSAIQATKTLLPVRFALTGFHDKGSVLRILEIEHLAAVPIAE